MNRKEELRAYIEMMIDEARKSRSNSFHVLCEEDDYERYMVMAFFVDDDEIVLEMAHNTVNTGFTDDNPAYNADTASINCLISDWMEIEDNFRS